jgi:hypothetical protein
MLVPVPVATRERERVRLGADDLLIVSGLAPRPFIEAASLGKRRGEGLAGNLSSLVAAP